MTGQPPGAEPTASWRARPRGTAGGLPREVWTHPADDPRTDARPAPPPPAAPEPPDVWAPHPDPIDLPPPRPHTPARGPAPASAPVSREPSSRMAHAAAATAGLSIAGSVLGLVRDQGIAHFFGAGAESDAFLVAWTIPEIAATVLIEDAMALLMVPAFSAALARGEGPRALVRGTLPRLLAALALLTAALAAGAGGVVRVLAPGIADPATAAACTRLTALTVLTFGVAGYLSAGLRAHRRFAAPAAIYAAYNTGIVAVLFTLHGRFGVRAAAAGVAVGGVLMITTQLPSFRRVLKSSPARSAGPRRGNPLRLALLAPVVVFTLGRQAQVLVERFFAAPLPAGAISHLNYAEKVAQLPMALSVMIVTVTFPVLSRALADGDREQARRRVERDLALACLVVLLGTSYVIACAPQIIEVLFQRGEFTAVDTADTATVMRVYALGLLGQSLVGALVRPYFSAAGPTWYPAAAMGCGLVVTAVADAAAVGPWGAYGIAAGNALGITVTAALLLRGLGAHTVAVRVAAVAPRIGRIALAALCATAAGWVLAHRLADPAVAAGACAVAVPAVFAGAALAVRVPEVPYLLATVTRKGRP
ncbi:putative membrane protein [Actinacidiphila reveromycinica]|uniref:Putative membrane protein n=1 Tax=Actinacidiphila reveromycinica TaxID=659352 RepID=A0A7U3UTW4_9ACTN|nr:lipid II flippase MurJ [Streptomyces sp. SN-593]BBA98568.1 putative membrane protein [Streptomyces sp. SN-593]